MKLAFIFNHPFHILSASQEPRDDAISAVTFLAIELAKLGHDITVFSQTVNNQDAFNIRCRTINITDKVLNIDQAILEEDYDTIIAKNCSLEFITTLLQSLKSKPKIFLWTSIPANSSINDGFNKPELIEQIDKFIFVSEWQKEQMLNFYNIPKHKIIVSRYAIASIYENLFVDAKEFLKVKSKPPYLVYTGPLLDGLEVLLEYYDQISSNYENTILSIYADLSSKENLNHTASKTQHIDYIGSIPTFKLASQLRTHTICVYPSKAEETQCIRLTEAMAAGLYIVTSQSSSLPEYCFGNGKQIKTEQLEDSSLNGFIGQFLNICQTQVHSPETFYDYCFKQVIEINKKHTWRVRAREWVEFLMN